MGIQWVRDTYGVPAKVRGRVEYSDQGKSYLGTITGTRGPHVLVRLDHAVCSRPFHPTWHLTYLTPPPRIP